MSCSRKNIRELLDKGQIALVGGVYDLETGKVCFLEEKLASN